MYNMKLVNSSPTRPLAHSLLTKPEVSSLLFARPASGCDLERCARYIQMSENQILVVMDQNKKNCFEFYEDLE
jgi:hypothetical protein